MDPELEDLLKAYDAVLEARGGPQHHELLSQYESRLDRVLARRPGLDRYRLEKAIQSAHFKWLCAQKRPPTLPPKA